MKKILSAVQLLLFVALLAACGSAPAQTAAPAATEAPTVIEAPAAIDTVAAEVTETVNPYEGEYDPTAPIEKWCKRPQGEAHFWWTLDRQGGVRDIESWKKVLKDYHFPKTWSFKFQNLEDETKIPVIIGYPVTGEDDTEFITIVSREAESRGAMLYALSDNGTRKYFVCHHGE